MVYKIMIADDEYPIRQGLAQGIDWASLGFEVCDVAANGEEALDKIKINVPDVLITDIRMPHMDGIELIENLSCMYPDLKIIILSGFGEFEYAQKAIEYCVSAYLLKPINNEDLYKTISMLKTELDIKRQLANKNAKSEISTGDAGLREYYMRQLVTGNRVQIKQMQDAYKKINVSIHKNCVAALVLSINFDETISSMWRLTGSLADYSEGLGYPVIYLNKNIYVLLSAPEKLKKTDAQRKARKIKMHFEEKIRTEFKDNCVISVGISTVSRELECFCKLSQEAAAAAQAKFYLGLGEIMFYSDIKSKLTNEMDRASFKSLSEELVSAILAGKSGEVLSRIKALFNEVMGSRYWNINKLAIRSMEIYLDILRKLEESSLEIEVPNEDELFADLSRSDTLKIFIDKFQIQLTCISDKIKAVKSMPENTLTLRIKKYVEENFESKLTLNEIAEYFSLNASYLSAYFKKNTGSNLFEYILKVRMEKAKDFLRYSDDQITIIAEKVGFPDYRYFCKTFKKETGYTPLQFRLKNYI